MKALLVTSQKARGRAVERRECMGATCVCVCVCVCVCMCERERFFFWVVEWKCEWDCLCVCCVNEDLHNKKMRREEGGKKRVQESRFSAF
jgi:hypothetical protein